MFSIILKETLHRDVEKEKKFKRESGYSLYLMLLLLMVMQKSETVLCYYWQY